MTDKSAETGLPNPLAEIDETMTSEQRLNALMSIVGALAKDLHKVKGEIAANTSMTKEVADGQIELKAAVDRIDLTALTDFLEAVSSMKGGIKVLGWLERPAKWIAAIATAGTIIYSLWSHK